MKINYLVNVLRNKLYITKRNEVGTTHNQCITLHDMHPIHEPVNIIIIKKKSSLLKIILLQS